MDDKHIRSVIEGLLFVAGDEGLEARQIAEILEMEPSQVVHIIHQMQEQFKREKRGIQIVGMAGTYQLATLPSHAPYFQKLANAPTRTTLSQAALETLAIIAYKQPITRIEIEEIRGVKSDRAIQSLLAKELIQEVGRAEVVGRPILYGTTKQFLDYFGLNSIEDLPDSNLFGSDKNLEEETRMLYEKLDHRQLTIDDVQDSEPSKNA